MGVGETDEGMKQKEKRKKLIDKKHTPIWWLPEGNGVEESGVKRGINGDGEKLDLG